MAEAETLPALRTSLFEAIEREDESMIAALLAQIVSLAHEGGLDGDGLLKLFQEHELQLGEGMQEWVYNRFALMDVG